MKGERAMGNITQARLQNSAKVAAIAERAGAAKPSNGETAEQLLMRAAL
jgi:hypothetical protein